MERSFLDVLDPRDRKDLLAVARRRRLARGTRIIQEGSEGSDAFVILEGQLKITAKGKGAKPVLIGLRGPGDLVGEAAVVDGALRSATVTAVEPSVVLVVPRPLFLRVINATSAAPALLHVLASRQRDGTRTITDFARLRAPARLASRVLDLVEQFGVKTAEGVEVSLGLTQDELAGWTGASRDSVAKTLRAWRDDGVVSTGRRRLLIHDVAKLEAIAEDHQ